MARRSAEGDIPRRANAAEERAAEIMVKAGVECRFEQWDRTAFRLYGDNVVVVVFDRVDIRCSKSRALVMYDFLLLPPR